MVDKNIEYIAYQGIKFTIEWYFNDQTKSIALEYYNQLPITRQVKLTKLLEIMGNTGAIKNTEKFIHEGQQIYAFKPHPDRFFASFLQELKY